jgi:hypothetical protein
MTLEVFRKWAGSYRIAAAGFYQAIVGVVGFVGR